MPCQSAAVVANETYLQYSIIIIFQFNTREHVKEPFSITVLSWLLSYVLPKVHGTRFKHVVAPSSSKHSSAQERTVGITMRLPWNQWRPLWTASFLRAPSASLIHETVSSGALFPFLQLYMQIWCKDSLTVAVTVVIWTQLARDRNSLSAVSKFGLIQINLVGSKHSRSQRRTHHIESSQYSLSVM